MESPVCKIGVITDSHVGLQHDGGWNQPVWRGGEEILFSRLREWRIQNQVDFIIHSGDVAEPDHIAKGVALLNSLGCPVAAVRGNHDIMRSFDYGVWQEELPKAPHVTFGDAVLENEHCDIVLLNNSWLDKKGLPQWQWRISPVGWLKDNQLNWLDGVLSQRTERPAILVVHYPLDIIPPYKISEDLARLNAEYSERLKSILNNYERVKIVASGHFHSTTTKEESGRLHLTTAAFSEAPFQVRLIEIYQSEITVDTHQLHQQGDPVKPDAAKSHLNGMDQVYRIPR